MTCFITGVNSIVHTMFSNTSPLASPCASAGSDSSSVRQKESTPGGSSSSLQRDKSTGRFTKADEPVSSAEKKSKGKGLQKAMLISPNLAIKLKFQRSNLDLALL